MHRPFNNKSTLAAQGRPSANTDLAWGAYRPSRFGIFMISLCHLLSNISFLKHVSLWVRRPLKYSGTRPVDVELWGLKLRLFPQGNVSETRLLFTPGLFDKEERLYLKRFLNDGSTFLDIGANAGGYSFWVYSLLRNDCRIYAVEPDPVLQAMLRFNIATNHAEAIKLISLALSDTDGKASFFLNQDNKGENQLVDEMDSNQSNTISVTVATLMSLVQSNGITKIDAMKVDIEDHEFRVLGHFFSHAEKSLWPRIIIAEERTSEKYDHLKSLLMDLGYAPDLKAKNNCAYSLSRPL
jgi:FkbM family methyltransferase